MDTTDVLKQYKLYLNATSDIDYDLHLNLFRYYLLTGELEQGCSNSEIEDVLKKILFMKRPSDSIRRFRDLCKSELDRRSVYALDVKKKEEIQRKLGHAYHLMEIMWKDIENTRDGRKTSKFEFYQRIIGLVVNDLPQIKTGLYSVNALMNKLSNKDNLNTDEHFYSLYANASAEMILTGLEMRLNFNIDDFARMVYSFNQTVRTTVKENMLLANYHREHTMISPQESYDAVGVSELIIVEKTSTRVQRAYELLLNELEVDYSDLKPPFRTITLEEAFEKYPELKMVSNPKQTINTSVAETMTVDATLEVN